MHHLVLKTMENILGLYPRTKFMWLCAVRLLEILFHGNTVLVGLPKSSRINIYNRERMFFSFFTSLYIFPPPLKNQQHISSLSWEDMPFSTGYIVMVRDIVPGSGKLEFPVPMHLAYSPILASNDQDPSRRQGKRKEWLKWKRLKSSTRVYLFLILISSDFLVDWMNATRERKYTELY
jgi:hypothetical protein